jgi:hypothetical protein
MYIKPGVDLIFKRQSLSYSLKAAVKATLVLRK